jgi:hypothetical protein
VASEDMLTIILSGPGPMVEFGEKSYTNWRYLAALAKARTYFAATFSPLLACGLRLASISLESKMRLSQ